jgi:hypothetical protein
VRPWLALLACLAAFSSLIGCSVLERRRIETHRRAEEVRLMAAERGVLDECRYRLAHQLDCPLPASWPVLIYRAPDSGFNLQLPSPLSAFGVL